LPYKWPFARTTVSLGRVFDMRHLRLLSGVIAGYGAMALLITLVQESWFGTVVGGGATHVVGRVMCLLVVTETTVLTLRGTLDGPFWFDVLAAGTLLAGILIGSAVASRRSEPATAAA
jgi:hypothetical protein